MPSNPACWVSCPGSKEMAGVGLESSMHDDLAYDIDDATLTAIVVDSVRLTHLSPSTPLLLLSWPLPQSAD